MKAFKYLCFAALSALVFISCKKDDPAPSKTTLQKVQAKWTFEKTVDHDFYSGVHTWDTSYYNANSYADFRTDGKVYSYFGGTNYDTSNYSVSADNKLTISSTGPFPFSETYNISVVNDNQLQLHVKEFDPAPDYYEYTEYLVK